MKTSKKIILLTVLFLLILPSITHAVSWWPLVPCGTSVNPTPCNQCDLLKLLKNIIDFVLIGLMPPAAAILFVWGGFLILMGGANPGWITQGRSIFWNTSIGVAIILASWLITNSIIRSLAADNVAPEWWKFECRVTTTAQQPPVPQPPEPQPEPGPGQPPVLQPQPSQPQPATLAITTSSLSDARQDFNYSQIVQATGGKTPYNWSIVGSLPSGLTINGSTGEIFGKPTTSGNFTFTIGLQDSSSPVKSATKQLSIKIVTLAASVVISNVASSNITNTSAVITWTTDKPSTSQVAYGTTTAYGPPTSLNSNQVTSHSVTITGLSPGTNYNYQAISSITGFTARASNNMLKTGGTTVQALSITTSSLPSATLGQSYSQQLAATGGTGTYSWSQVSGTLPTGLNLSANGRITGTLTGSITGNATFTVKVEDTSSPKQSATKQFTIVVTGGGTAGDTCPLPQTLATQHNTIFPAKKAPKLENLLSCISGRLGQSLPPEGGANAFFGSLFSIDGSSPLCNYTRGDRHCDSSCSHAVSSCHYGGKTGTQGSLAVDFGNERNGDIIIEAAVACGVPTSKARCENAAGKNVSCAPNSGANHIHISAPTCDAN